ncbi:inactive protein RESTRICTED TEV MOVEMENT 2-like [Quercus robur]|uniref:inactive protein RESTRICTED TEV MOVEMENT 2-like n=1 Tax=Quercus robur TaxID=38942 RepID=UPI002161FC62|nr:inactive protein RESTRICTED TEV MOVEMENT 2-like [Quercus robur]
MAMKQRSGGISATLPRQSVRLVYENFQPISERKEDEGSTILLVHLPGFVEKRIKFIYLNNARMVRVHGERPLGDNKWSRFNETFPVPENCDVDQIHGKFYQGILTITMPKQVIAKAGPSKEQAKATQKAPHPPKSSAETEPQKVQEVIPPKPTSSTWDEKQREKKASIESKVQKVVEDVPPKATSTAKDSKEREVKIGQSESPEKAQKGQDVTPPKATSSSDTKRQMKEKNVELRDYKIVEKKHFEWNGAKENEKGVEKNMVIKGKESGETSAKLEMGESSTASKVSVEKEKKRKEIYGGGNKEEPESNGVYHDAEEEGFKGVTVSAMKRVKNLTKRVNEDERQMLVNIGAAVLVIFALGAYVSYSYISSRRAKN